jgi:hypothetical protein
VKRRALNVANADVLAIKAFHAQAKKEKRIRVCTLCQTPGDAVLGWIASENACERCGVRPCQGVMVSL